MAEVARRIGRDWQYAAPGFDAGLRYLQRGPETYRQGEKIWQHGNNEVFRLRLPKACGGDDVVYKHTVGKGRWNHCVSASAAVREAVNMRAMAALGFPMVEMLAVGERRTWRSWTEAFLVTRFADGYLDGRHLLPGFDYGDNLEVRDAFVSAALGHMAAMHAAGISHKGFKVYNILWRQADDGVRLLFLDVASCRMIPGRPFLRHMLRDLAYFLKPFGFSAPEVERWLAVYLDGNPPLSLSAASLMDRLAPFLARAGFNWEQVLGGK